MGQGIFLWTDTRLTGFGGVLEQREDGKRVPIVYASRMTTLAEKKYELEVTTLVHALEHFEAYLLGNLSIPIIRLWFNRIYHTCRVSRREC